MPKRPIADAVGEPPKMCICYASYTQGKAAVLDNIRQQRILELSSLNSPVMDWIQMVVHDASKAVILASWLIGLHLHRACTAGQFDLSVDQSFCKTALALVSQTKGTPGLKQQRLMESLEVFKEFNFPKPDGDGLSQALGR